MNFDPQRHDSGEINNAAAHANILTAVRRSGFAGRMLLMRRDELSKACLALTRFSLIWFGTLVVGFPLVVLVLGFRLSEGWSFLVANKRFVVLVSLFPYPFIGIRAAEAYFNSWIERRFGSTSKDTEAARPHDQD